MVLQLFTSAVVTVVGSSWIAASIFLKYFLVGLAAKNVYQGRVSLESFLGDVMESSELVVTSIIGAGMLISLAGLSPRPLFKLFSELVALGYFGYLFWKY